MDTGMILEDGGKDSPSGKVHVQVDKGAEGIFKALLEQDPMLEV